MGGSADQDSGRFGEAWELPHWCVGGGIKVHGQAMATLWACGRLVKPRQNAGAVEGVGARQPHDCVTAFRRRREILHAYRALGARHGEEAPNDRDALAREEQRLGLALSHVTLLVCLFLMLHMTI